MSRLICHQDSVQMFQLRIRTHQILIMVNVLNFEHFSLSILKLNVGYQG